MVSSAWLAMQLAMACMPSTGLSMVAPLLMGQALSTRAVLPTEFIVVEPTLASGAKDSAVHNGHAEINKMNRLSCRTPVTRACSHLATTIMATLMKLFGLQRC